MHDKTMLLNKAEYNPPIFRVHHAINGEEAGRADELEVCCRQSGDVTCIRALCRTQPTFSLDPPSARSMLATRSYFCNCKDTDLLQTGDSPLHTAEYINDKGERIWLKFDPSRPCTMFPTYESRCVLYR